MLPEVKDDKNMGSELESLDGGSHRYTWGFKVVITAFEYEISC